MREKTAGQHGIGEAKKQGQNAGREEKEDGTDHPASGGFGEKIPVSDGGECDQRIPDRIRKAENAILVAVSRFGRSQQKNQQKIARNGADNQGDTFFLDPAHLLLIAAARSRHCCFPVHISDQLPRRHTVPSKYAEIISQCYRAEK